MKALRNLEMKDFQTSGFLPCFLQAPISIMQAHPSCSPQAGPRDPSVPGPAAWNSFLLYCYRLCPGSLLATI